MKLTDTVLAAVLGVLVYEGVRYQIKVNESNRAAIKSLQKGNTDEMTAREALAQQVSRLDQYTTGIGGELDTFAAKLQKALDNDAELAAKLQEQGIDQETIDSVKNAADRLQATFEGHAVPDPVEPGAPITPAPTPEPLPELPVDNGTGGEIAPPTPITPPDTTGATEPVGAGSVDPLAGGDDSSAEPATGSTEDVQP